MYTNTSLLFHAMKKRSYSNNIKKAQFFKNCAHGSRDIKLIGTNESLEIVHDQRTRKVRDLLDRSIMILLKQETQFL